MPDMSGGRVAPDVSFRKRECTVRSNDVGADLKISLVMWSGPGALLVASLRAHFSNCAYDWRYERTHPSSCGAWSRVIGSVGELSNGYGALVSEEGGARRASKWPWTASTIEGPYVSGCP